MDSRRYRVAQWATGNTGQRALREVIRHPALDLVGVLVFDPAKEGVDAGELCGEGQTGIAATRDRAAVFELNADCVLYMPRAAGDPRARAGLTVGEVIDDVVTLLESGTNIVTTVTDFHAGGHPRLGEEGFARIRAACRRAAIHRSLRRGAAPGSTRKHCRSRFWLRSGAWSWWRSPSTAISPTGRRQTWCSIRWASASLSPSSTPRDGRRT